MQENNTQQIIANHFAWKNYPEHVEVQVVRQHVKNINKKLKKAFKHLYKKREQFKDFYSKRGEFPKS